MKLTKISTEVNLNMKSLEKDILELTDPRFQIVRDIPQPNKHDTETKVFLFQINVTRDCNLRCTHCYISSEAKALSGRLSVSQFLKIVRDIGKYMITAENTHAEIHVIGGEPTMLGATFYNRVMPEAYKILQEYGDAFSWEFILVSNLLSKEMMAIAPWFPKISTAYEPETRFPKQFHEDWWLTNVHKLQNGGINVGITTCMTKPVIDYGAANLCDRIYNELGIKQMHFGFYIESGDGRINAETVTPTFSATSEFLIESAKWYFERRDSDPDLYVNPAESMLSAIHRDEPLDDIVCPIISGSLDIDSSGNALTCIQAGGEVDAPWEGHVLKTSISDVINGDKFKRRRIQAAKPHSACMTCDEYRVCRSGCGVNFKNWDPAGGDDCPGYKRFIKFMRSAYAAGLRPRHADYRSMTSY
jgi:radical SAM protein with 4Fe4S-binding SPASM domain